MSSEVGGTHRTRCSPTDGRELLSAVTEICSNGSMSSEPADRIDALEAGGLRLQTGDQRAEDLPSIATEALLEGHDSPWLRRAAGAPRDDSDTARQWFIWALEELGFQCDVDEQQARWRIIRDIARRVTDGDLDPGLGARQIRQHRDHLEAEGDLRIFAGLDSVLEDHPDALLDLHSQIRQEAAALLARPSLRTWVLLKAGVGIDWPLWRPTPRRVLAPDAYPISVSLREDLVKWVAVFPMNSDLAGARDRGQNRSVFATQEAAAAFVHEGEILAGRLQSELGESHYVEYYPEPVRPTGGFRSSSQRR